jgi:hypothetical protein
MAEKTIAAKLLIKSGTAVWATPADELARIGPLPEGVTHASAPAEAATAIVFAAHEAALRQALAEHGAELGRVGTLWIAYPKGGRSDLNRDTLWPIVSELGLRPIAQVAIDETWSALRFRPLAPGEPQFAGAQQSR